MSLTILAIFAHPDDEISVGSTLAYYSTAGVRTVLICASRGEAATIYCDDCATRENLAQVRTRELECACAHLGIAELHWLDWPDGGIAQLPRREAIGEVVARIRQIRPAVILTHPENGLYPHPDHLAVWEIVRAAFTAAADPDEYPEKGAAWPVARLFTRAIPQSFFDAAPAFARYRVRLGDQQLPFVGTPDDQIDVVMHVGPWAERRMAAWECHRSQHNPDGAFAQMPEAVRRAMAEQEHFVLAAARVPLPEGVHDDLLAGLSQSEADSEPSTLVASPALISTLRHQAALHRSLAELCQTYLAALPEPKYAAALERLANGEQEILSYLARFLRMHGSPSGEIGTDPRVRAEGMHLKEAAEQLSFLRAYLDRAEKSCQAHVAATGDPAVQRFWRELGSLIQGQLDSLDT